MVAAGDRGLSSDGLSIYYREFYPHLGTRIQSGQPKPLEANQEEEDREQGIAEGYRRSGLSVRGHLPGNKAQAGRESSDPNRTSGATYSAANLSSLWKSSFFTFRFSTMASTTRSVLWTTDAGSVLVDMLLRVFSTNSPPAYCSGRKESTHLVTKNGV